MSYVVRYDSLEEKQKLGRLLDENGFENIRGEQFQYLEKYSAQCICINTKSKNYYPVNITCAAGASCGGLRFYTVDEFELLLNSNFTAKLRTPIFHIPHCGSELPEELMKDICIEEEKFKDYHEMMADTGVTEFVPHQFFYKPFTVIFPVSRLLCDVERFTGTDEPMEKYGMGYCYEKAFDGTVIKNIKSDAGEKCLRYYKEHHKLLDETVNRFPSVILIDLHSFSEKIVMPEYKGSRPMPDICIGTDERYTTKKLADAAEDIFRAAGFTVERNYPYSGSMVPNIVLKGKTDCDLLSVMIEVNKAVCLDENGEVIELVKLKIQDAIKKIIVASHSIGSAREEAQNSGGSSKDYEDFWAEIMEKIEEYNRARIRAVREKVLRITGDPAIKYIKGMNYDEFRAMYDDDEVEEFRKAYAEFSYEEAKALIDPSAGGPAIKACKIDFWRECRRQYKGIVGDGR